MIGKEDITREEVIDFMGKVQGQLCSYVQPGKIGPTTFCDCKFGADKVGGQGERGNGCPEMRVLRGFFHWMTDKEFEKILKRAYKKRACKPPKTKVKKSVVTALMASVLKDA